MPERNGADVVVPLYRPRASDQDVGKPAADNPCSAPASTGLTGKRPCSDTSSVNQVVDVDSNARLRQKPVAGTSIVSRDHGSVCWACAHDCRSCHCLYFSFDFFGTWPVHSGPGAAGEALGWQHTKVGSLSGVMLSFRCTSHRNSPSKCYLV